MSLEYVKNKIEFYQDFPIEGVEYIDLNPIYKDPKARSFLVDKCIESIKDIQYDLKKSKQILSCLLSQIILGS